VDAAADRDIRRTIGAFPYRMALAGGWIDQPFVSRADPEPPGSMVVVSLEPDFRWMERCGMATGTRHVALRLWGGALPRGDVASLVRELYQEENRGRAEPSGSQDMIGLLYPGVSRLDYDAACEGGVFPRYIQSNTDPAVARWLERVIHVVPVAPRPDGYSPLGVKNLEPSWIRRLGASGAACYAAIVSGSLADLAESMNECMRCWEAILPQTVSHRLISVDLMGILRHYQARYAGAMYSGCGGGYLYVASEEPVPGAFRVRVRTCDAERAG
jgi:hypothetical protein